MPSVSDPQKRLMLAVDHGWHKPGGGGPSRAVAHDFVQADKQVGRVMSNKGYQSKTQHFAQGGAVLGKESQFLKTPDQFREDKSKSTDENWGKSTDGTKGDGGPAAPAAKGKSLAPVKPKA